MSTITVETVAAEEVLVESILKQVEQLPRATQLRLAQSIRDQHINPVKPPLDKRVPCKPLPDRSSERKWIEEHKHEYAGQWVALDGERLVAASFIQQEVWDAVPTDTETPPLVTRIPAPDDLPFMGI